jgi:uncharacterized RDD family membrane protein YckC
MNNLPKVIPLWLFRTIGITMLLLSLLATLLFVLTFSGPYEFFAELLTDESNSYPPEVAALFTFFVTLLPCVVVSLILRPFSQVPSLRSQLTDPGPFNPKFKTDADTSRYGELPSMFSRIAAFVIDRFIVIMVIAIPAGIFGALMEDSKLHGSLYDISIVLFIFCALAAMIYSYSRDMIGGKSIARRLLKQKVVDLETGNPIGGLRSFKREVFVHFAPLLIIELILISSKKDRRRIGDNWAKSIVIKEQSDVIDFTRQT